MLLRQQLIAARETAKALVASIDAALQAIEQPEPVDLNAPCQHPAEVRVPAASMGRSGAFICGKCSETVN